MSRKGWAALIAGAIILLFAGRMVFRYLDWQASQSARDEAGAAVP